MTSNSKRLRLFILGATGGTGRQLVAQSLERGHSVTAYVRSPEKLGSARDGVTIVQGDLQDVRAIAAALEGHDAVLSAVGPPGPGRNTITSQAAQSTVSAMQAVGLRRLLVVGVAVLFADAGILARIFRQTLLRNVADDSAAMERIVTGSNLDWTIACPPRLTNGPQTGRYGVLNDHLPIQSGGGAATLSRADLAHFLLNEVEHPEHLRRIVGLAYIKSAR